MALRTKGVEIAADAFCDPMTIWKISSPAPAVRPFARMTARYRRPGTDGVMLRWLISTPPVLAGDCATTPSAATVGKVHPAAAGRLYELP